MKGESGIRRGKVVYEGKRWYMKAMYKYLLPIPVAALSFSRAAR